MKARGIGVEMRREEQHELRQRERDQHEGHGVPGVERERARSDSQ